MASTEFYVDIDLQENELINASLQDVDGGGLPTGTKTGLIAYDEAIKYYDGTEWVTVATTTQLPTGAVSKYAETVSLGSSIGPVTITHNLNTTDVIIQAFTVSNGKLANISSVAPGLNTISVNANGATKAYRVIVVG